MPNPSSFVPPGVTSIINVVTAFGAVGDAVIASNGTVTGTDNTTAFINAIAAAQPFPASSADYGHCIYIPPGTYMVSDKLDMKSAGGIPGAGIRFLGEHVDETEVVLKHSATGYSSGSTQKALFSFNSSGVANSNTAFKNAIIGVTITIGASNPGASAVDMGVSNMGGLKNVHLRSVDPSGFGYSGIALTRIYPGPGYFENIVIEGFNYGIDIGTFEYGVIVEHLILRNQLVAGVRNNLNLIGLRDVDSTQNNGIPAVLNTHASSFTTIMEASLDNSGGAAGSSAMNNVIGGHFRCRNIRSAGYTYKLANKAIGGSTVVNYDDKQLGDSDEFTNGAITTLFPGQIFNSLNLPVMEAPEYYDNNVSEWANVMDYGAVHGNSVDQAPYIQAALNSGKSTIYLPSGPPSITSENNNFLVKSGIVIPPTVKRIICFLATIVSGGPNWPAGVNCWTVADGTSDPLFMDSIYMKSSTSSVTAQNGYSDAVTTAGSNIFTSATANFSSSWIGRCVVDYTNDAITAIPPNTFVTACTDTHTLVMSNNATASGTRQLRTGGNFSPTAGLAGGHWIEHNSRRPLIINECGMGGGNVGVVVRSGSGYVHMKGTYGSLEMEPDTRVWLRSHDTEAPGDRGIYNNGGDLWIFGLKTEQFGTKITTTGGGRTEFEAGFLLPLAPDWTAAPAFVCVDSQHTLSWMSIGYQQYHAQYEISVRETKNGVTNDLNRASVQKRYNGYSDVMALHIGRLV